MIVTTSEADLRDAEGLKPEKVWAENGRNLGQVPDDAADVRMNWHKHGPVAQLDRASDFGSEGWGFDSLRGRH